MVKYDKYGAKIRENIIVTLINHFSHVQFTAESF